MRCCLQRQYGVGGGRALVVKSSRGRAEREEKMNLRTCCLKLALAACAAMAATAAADAATSTLTYVSVTGSNAGACSSPAAPCRTLPFAAARTKAGGELRVLDSGFFANTVITRSITISGDHVTLVATTLTIDNAAAIVTLRGLTLSGVGQPANANAITINTAAAVHIENCVIEGFPQRGLFDEADNADLTVTDSVVRDNGEGLDVINAPGARLTVDNSRFENNAGNGLSVSNGTASVSRSVASGNANTGMTAANAGTTMAVVSSISSYNLDGYRVSNGGVMMVESAVARSNDTGLHVFGGATAQISDSTFVSNNIGIAMTGSAVRTRGNNTLDGNSTNLIGSLTPINGV
jgi:hypothetical protein